MTSIRKKDITSGTNLPLTVVLRKLRQLLNSPNKVIEEVSTLPRYHDEPHFYQFLARTVEKTPGLSSASVGVGTSLDKRRAEIKALAEAAERSRLARMPDLSMEGAASNMSDIIDLKDLPEFYRRNRALHETKRLPMLWIRGYELDNKRLKRVNVPAQFVTVPYHFKETEPVVREPISTGTALGTNYVTSVLRGLMEVIERDAFMLSYYQSRVNHEVLPADVRSLASYMRELTRCRLSLRLFDISTDAGGYVFLALLLDDTGIGPHLTAGMKAGFDAVTVAQDSIAEAVQLRTWLRDLMISTVATARKVVPNEIVSLKDRAMFWLDPSRRSELDCYLECRTHVKLSDYPRQAELNPVDLLQLQLKRLSGLGIKLYFVDLTDPVLFRSGFKVTKTITTKLQPMHLDERSGFPIGPRFSTVHLKSTPHFFL